MFNSGSSQFMQPTNRDNLLTLVQSNFGKEPKDWFFEKLEIILNSNSPRDLYIAYSLCGSKLDDTVLQRIDSHDDLLNSYFSEHQITQVQLGRVALISCALDENSDFFTPKVQNLIEVADKVELATFLRYLIVLPNPGDFQMVAADALRTNIATVFNALSQKNPYPGQYFNDQQWNQMFLKAAFMQCDLSGISDIDKRANEDLSRIISDYAHERWAASRQVDPYFWRPTTKFIKNDLVNDMTRLFESSNPIENKAAALCCFYANTKQAKELIYQHPELVTQIESGILTWDNLKH
jgi:hypothetical protein